ncbi:thrombospondin type-1 domain-containing protein 4-like [Gigantopelta aegis]|uniref:thrombospondin type-1 domain-containing protein 4-like n=1 Tax=Gigantopelta aegis TaxID=1735272 RepID=UPI001B88767F|nr:thrombospondin type-1 domain-containing protein 4-like [Gigantopelta aegis]
MWHQSTLGGSENSFSVKPDVHYSRHSELSEDALKPKTESHLLIIDPSLLFTSEDLRNKSSVRIVRMQSQNKAQNTPTRTDSKTLCQGPEKQYKVCKNTCAGTNSDYRSVECEKHNGKYFGGRRYEWQAYINPYNRCELSCKARNYRYYARFGDRVDDGTSCKPDKEAVCISGKCLNISYDNVSYDNVSYENVSYDNISYDNVSYDNISYDNVSYDVSYDNVSYDNISYENVSYDNVSYENVSYDNVSYENISYDISYDNVSYENVSWYSDVGCDGIAGSGTEVDQCGVCGGDNKSCRIISGIFTRTHLKHFGYNAITTIPAGACNINITELARSRNYLALKTEDGSYFLNGNRRLHPTGSYHGAGTEFEYHRRKHNRCPGECIQAKGPTNTAVIVELLYYHRNPGIMYHFTIPKDLMGSVMKHMIAEDDNNIKPGETTHKSGERTLESGETTLKPGETTLKSGETTLNQGRQRSTQGKDSPTPSVEQQNDEDVLKSQKDRHIIPAPRWVDRSLQNIKYGQSPQYIPSRTRNQQLQLVDKTSKPQTYRYSDSGFRKSRQSVRGLYARRYQDLQGGVKAEITGKRKPSKVFKKQPHPKRHQIHPRHRSRSRLQSYSRQARVQPAKRHSAVPVQQTPSRSSSHLGSSGRVLGGGSGGTGRQYYHTNQYQTGGGYVDRQHTYGTQPDVNRLVQRNYQHAVSLSNKPYRYDNTITQTSANLRSPVYASPLDGIYSWRISGFSECSTTCGGGSQVTEIVCVKGNSQVVVTADNCEPTNIPRRQTVACNTQPCPPDWEPADWGECSRTCGMGIQSRTVECRRRISPTVAVSVSASHCNNSARPAVTQMCQVRPCAEWKLTDWSQCSTDCGLGERSRKVTCISTEGIIVSDRRCGLRKPAVKEVCDMGSCAQGWYHTKWSGQCSSHCGSGVYTRKVYCSSSDGSELPAKKCLSSKKPREHKSCKGNLPCGGIWFTGPWSKCNATCGIAWKTRDVVCMKNLGGSLLTIVTEENCLAEKKSSTEELCSKRPSCKPQWYMTEWSKCSVSCGTGSKTREVKCLDPELVPSFDCKPSRRPRERQSCNRQSCSVKKKPIIRTSNRIQKDERGGSECVDVFPDWCRLVKQARICGYSYYKQQCCVTCRDHKS